MKILLNSLIFFFDFIDKFIHQKRILNFFLKKNLKINFYVDVGCHKGSYADLFINNFKLKQIMMFEPQKDIFHYLRKKYRNFNRIKIINFAVSNKDGFKNLNLNHHDLTTTLSNFNKNNFYLKIKALLFGVENMTYKKIKVKTIRLDKILSSNKFKKIDLLKVDTEGHELEVLVGLNKKIKSVRYILIEFHNDFIYRKYNPSKIHNYLKKNNFSLEVKFKFPFTTWEDRIYLNKDELK